MPIKTGTRQLGLQPGAKISHKSKGAPRTMRCPACRGQALESPNGKGGIVMRCRNCHREFASSAM